LNNSVFSWRRNAKYVDDILTDEGNAFQARAAATGKARSPVARRVDGTSSVAVDPDLGVGNAGCGRTVGMEWGWGQFDVPVHLFSKLSSPHRRVDKDLLLSHGKL